MNKLLLIILFTSPVSVMGYDWTFDYCIGREDGSGSSEEPIEPKDVSTGWIISTIVMMVFLVCVLIPDVVKFYKKRNTVYTMPARIGILFSFSLFWSLASTISNLPYLELCSVNNAKSCIFDIIGYLQTCELLLLTLVLWIMYLILFKNKENKGYKNFWKRFIFEMFLATLFFGLSLYLTFGEDECSPYLFVMFAICGFISLLFLLLTMFKIIIPMVRKDTEQIEPLRYNVITTIYFLWLSINMFGTHQDSLLCIVSSCVCALYICVTGIQLKVEWIDHGGKKFYLTKVKEFFNYFRAKLGMKLYPIDEEYKNIHNVDKKETVEDTQDELFVNDDLFSSTLYNSIEMETAPEDPLLGNDQK